MSGQFPVLSAKLGSVQIPLTYSVSNGSFAPTVVALAPANFDGSKFDASNIGSVQVKCGNTAFPFVSPAVKTVSLMNCAGGVGSVSFSMANADALALTAGFGTLSIPCEVTLVDSDGTLNYVIVANGNINITVLP